MSWWQVLQASAPAKSEAFVSGLPGAFFACPAGADLLALVDCTLGCCAKASVANRLVAIHNPRILKTPNCRINSSGNFLGQACPDDDRIACVVVLFRWLMDAYSAVRVQRVALISSGKSGY